MLNGIVDIAKSATAFLQSGVAPPNTSPAYKEALEDENHFASKKFFIIFSSLFMLAFVFYTSVGLLWLIPNTPEMVTAFVTIFTKMIEIFGIIISVYLGAQGLVDLRYNSLINALPITKLLIKLLSKLALLQSMQCKKCTALKWKECN
jgi:hypothetical protein